MTRGNKSTKQQTGTTEDSNDRKRASGPQGKARGWSAADKLAGASKKIDARRKVPSGPLGGSGRKTNLSRSS